MILCHDHDQCSIDADGRRFVRVEVAPPAYRLINNWPEYKYPTIRLAVPSELMVLADEIGGTLHYDEVVYQKERWGHRQWVVERLSRCFECKAIVEEGFWHVLEWEVMRRVGDSRK